MTEERKYVVELTSEQVTALSQACEMYARLSMLQLNMVVEDTCLREPMYTRLRKYYKDSYDVVRNVVESLLEQVKSLLSPELGRNAYYGIRSPEVSEKAHITWDIYQALRYVQSWEERPLKKGEFQTVNYDEPLITSMQPLPKIEVKK